MYTDPNRLLRNRRRALHGVLPERGEREMVLFRRLLCQRSAQRRRRRLEGRLRSHLPPQRPEGAPLRIDPRLRSSGAAEVWIP